MSKAVKQRSELQNAQAQMYRDLGSLKLLSVHAQNLKSRYDPFDCHNLDVEAWEKKMRKEILASYEAAKRKFLKERAKKQLEKLEEGIPF